ncbi:PBDC1 family protein [Megaselia abdita]
MDVLSRPADEFGNDGLVEEIWAKSAAEHAEVFFNLISTLDPKTIQLTPYDDVIYTTFRQDFPNLDVSVLSDDILKEPSEKIRWRSFCDKFNKVEDFSFGTLLRADASLDNSPENTLLVVRIQFLAIEIARNREGFNDSIRKKFKVVSPSLSS